MIHSKTTLETSPHLITSENDPKHKDQYTHHQDKYHEQIANNPTYQENKKKNICSKPSTFKTLPIEELTKWNAEINQNYALTNNNEEEDKTHLNHKKEDFSSDQYHKETTQDFITSPIEKKSKLTQITSYS